MSEAPQTETHHNGEAESTEVKWGRVLVCGGTNWAKLGKKDKPGAAISEEDRPDLLEPHILRSLSNVKAVSIHTSCCSCHCIVLDVDGTAWMFGRNTPPAMGLPSNSFGEISECAPRSITARELGAAEGSKFVHAACGRGHSLLVGSGGEVWACGANLSGQCGQNPSPEVPHWKLVDGPWSRGANKQKVVQVGAGVSFSLALTDEGKVYAFGSAEKGQLGNGKTGEHIATGNKILFDLHSDPILVRNLESHKIVSLSCGNQHSILLDSEGYVYTFGYNGYCRLGHGDQVDCLTPKVVAQFANSKESLRGGFVVAGPTCSIVIDRQKMLYLCGKFKNSGDGSSGQPWSSFKYVPDIMSCKIDFASLGGVTIWALTADEDGSMMTVAWGQNAHNGELGMGADQPKSATKPTQVNPLKGIEVFAVAAAQNTTFMLALPNDKLSDLPRHPDEVGPADECNVCSKDKKDDSPIVCEKCDQPYHLSCLNPPLSEVPTGEWFCASCEASPGAPIFAIDTDKSKYLVEALKKSAAAGGGGRGKKASAKHVEEDEDDEDDDDGAKTGTKRKAGAAGKAGAKRKK
ncbi:RCC1/BLIP-II protein [Sistotremastrum suecicum HHB10207 ss-3]|uniref:RCC1/BLIP-II protein n=1 Tax=Sistotremastrum suecicum HHB10207 ss-3 TaxID=1314776 RepID=A0A166BXS4_9AGAM|nr:RCC1/BLIP-II protein [Sistotremastrum suecicum HHB10207 ss-3]